MNFYASHCKGNWLHKYVLISVHPDAVLERCERCGKRNITKLHNGIPDAVRYAMGHMREFLIPQHPRFYKEYPKHA